MGEWFYMMAELPERARQEVAAWVLEQQWPEGTKLKRPSRYHVTIVYSFDGRNRADLPAMIQAASTGWNRQCNFKGVETFTPAPLRDGTLQEVNPVVLTISSPMLVQAGTIIMDRFKTAGFKVSEFDKGYQPHITVAMVPQASQIELAAPNISFRLQPRATTGGYKMPQRTIPEENLTL